MVCGRIMEQIRWHWSDVAQRRTPEQEEAERYLICGMIRFNRLMLVPAAVLTQTCIGSIYAWSVYNLPIERYAGFETGSAANTFYIALGLFGPSAAVFGPWLERHGPRKTLLLSSHFFLAAHLLAALSIWQKSLIGLYLSYGVLGGCGIGTSYITPVSPLQKWFPDYRGLVAGLAVAGFGGGTIIAAKTQNALLGSVGVPQTFLVLGSVYYVLMLCSAMVLRTPPSDFQVPERGARRAGAAQASAMQLPSEASTAASESESKEQAASISEQQRLKETEDALKKIDLLDALKTWDYRLMWVMLACNACAGMMTVSKMADICQLQFGTSSDFASTAVAVNSVFNLSGRIILPGLSDYVGRKPLFLLSLVLQAIIVWSTPSMLSSGAVWLWVICMWLLTAFYGSGFGLIPAFLTDMFGPKNIGALHGVILTAKSTVAVAGGFTFTALYQSATQAVARANGIDPQTATKEQLRMIKADRTVYNVNYTWIGCVILVGILLTPFIRTGRDRLLPSRPGQLFALRLGPRLLRYSSDGLELVPRAKEQKEWEEYLRSLPQFTQSQKV